jgi:hypothetical protein
MTARDRTIIFVLALVVIAGAAWFTAIKPRRAEATALTGQVAAAQQRLDAAQVALQAARQAQKTYAGDYAAIARLGKAVPVDDDVPSLLVQLQSAAKSSNIDFRSMTLDASAAAASAAKAPAVTTPAATGAAGTSSGSSPSGTSTTATTATTPATPPTGTTPSSSGTPAAATGAAAAAATAADATQAAAAGLPPGAAVGAAGFPTMPFNFAFNGSFFKLEDFLRAVDRFTTVDGKQVTVRGRLLTIDGISLTASPDGFPKMTAKVKATAYLLPADEGLTLGGTPAAPATASSPATPASDPSSSTSTPAPAAVITGAAR